MWFKVKDRLPATYEDVLVTDGIYVAVAFNDCYDKWIPSNVELSYDMSECYIDFTPTHWTDLPELPGKTNCHD